MGDVRLQDLERDLAIVFPVMAKVHRGLAAFTQLTLDTVAIGERFFYSDGLIQHRPKMEPDRPDGESSGRRWASNPPGLTRLELSGGATGSACQAMRFINSPP